MAVLLTGETPVLLTGETPVLLTGEMAVILTGEMAVLLTGEMAVILTGETPVLRRGSVSSSDVEILELALLATGAVAVGQARRTNALNPAGPDVQLD